MKTLQQVQKEIYELRHDAEAVYRTAGFHDSPTLKRKYGSLSKKVELLETFLKYLETEPTEEYLTKEKERLTNRIQLLDKAFEGRKTSSNDLWKEYQRVNDYPTLKRHLKNVEYLLAA